MLKHQSLFFPHDPKCLYGFSSTMPTVSDCLGLHSVNMLFINPHSTLSLSPCCVFRMVLITGKREWVGGRMLSCQPHPPLTRSHLFCQRKEASPMFAWAPACPAALLFVAFLTWINGNKLIGWAFAVPWCWHDTNDSSTCLLYNSTNRHRSHP